jgi:hypothetical protein
MAVLAPNPVTKFTSKLWIGSADPITSGNGYQFDFGRFGLGRRGTLSNYPGMRGTRSRFGNRTRVTAYSVSGPVEFPEITVAELAAILKYCLGGAPSGTSYPLADALPSCAVGFLKGGLRYYIFGGCIVDWWELNAGPGTPLGLTVNFMGTSRSVGAANTAPTGTTQDSVTQPLVFSDAAGAITIAGDVQNDLRFRLRVQNGGTERRANALYPTAVYPTDRDAVIELSTGYGDKPDLPELDPNGVAVTAVFTNGLTSFSVVLPCCQFPGDDSEVDAGRDEITFPLVGSPRVAPGGASGSEIQLTLDSTP